MTSTVCETAAQETLASYCTEIERCINQDLLKLPVLPQAIREILSMKNDPEFSVARLSKLIHQDATLAGHVLRISNSSAYAGAYKTATLNQAIMRLGGHALVRIAVSITMKGEVFQVAGFEDEVKGIWSRSFAGGVYAQEIAEMCGCKDEGMYMCGLMHQVGKPVLLQTIVEFGKRNNLSLNHEIIEYLLDKYHSLIGFRMADAWKLPWTVKAACMHYEDPLSVEATAEAILITHLASKAANLVQSTSEEEEMKFMMNPAIELLNLRGDHIERLFGMRDQVNALLDAISI